jgi:hypothetical protein
VAPAQGGDEQGGDGEVEQVGGQQRTGEQDAAALALATASPLPAAASSGRWRPRQRFRSITGRAARHHTAITTDQRGCSPTLLSASPPARFGRGALPPGRRSDPPGCEALGRRPARRRTGSGPAAGHRTIAATPTTPATTISRRVERNAERPGRRENEEETSAASTTRETVSAATSWEAVGERSGSSAEGWRSARPSDVLVEEPDRVADGARGMSLRGWTSPPAASTPPASRSS